MTFGDIVTGIDVEKTGLPPKELIYPLPVLLVLIVSLSQWRRRRQDASPDTAPATT